MAFQPDYVPNEGWGEDQDDQNLERWFGRQLQALREPPLATAPDLVGYAERVRLLTLPNSSPAYVYRIDIKRDGSAKFRWAITSGMGGYDPGDLAHQYLRKLTSAEVERVNFSIKHAFVEVLPRRTNDIEVSQDGDKSIRMCVHGTHFIFERLTANRRIYLMRNCDIDEPDLKNLARELSELKLRRQMK